MGGIDKNSKLYFCKKSGCRRSIQSHSGRYKHQLLCKNEEKQPTKYTIVDGGVICVICDRKYTTKQNYYRHKNICGKPAKKEEKRYECNVCSKVFSKNYDLQRHLKTHAVKEKLQCEKCNKVCIRRDMYDTHIANNCNMLLDDSEDSEQNKFIDTDISDVEVNEKEDETRNVSDNEDIHDFVLTMADEARRKYMYRKTNEVKETLEKLSCLDIEDQVKVLRRSMEVTAPRVVENLLMSDLDSVYQAKTAEGILQHLKNSPKMPKAQLCSMLYRML